MASIKQRADGIWRARYRDTAGKEHARHFKLKRDAQRWLDEVSASVLTGQYVDPRAGRVTWDSWVKAWMERQAWASGTLQGARTAVNSVPWGDQPISAIKPSHVQAWVTELTKRGIAASTMRTYMSHVRHAFRDAVADRVIPINPATGVKPPRQRRAEHTMKILTAEQVATLLDAAVDFRPFVEVCVFAGLRLGEAAGLQLGDVNFLRRTIDVRRQSVPVKGLPGGTLVPPKHGSERTVYVPADLIDSLAAHVASEGITEPDEHLFRNPLGRLWYRQNAGVEFRRIREAVGLSSDVHLHTLRHTFASNLIASGCDVVTVQRALGHASPSITLNVYSHLWPTAEDKTRGATSDFMREVADRLPFNETPRTSPVLTRTRVRNESAESPVDGTTRHDGTRPRSA